MQRRQFVIATAAGAAASLLSACGTTSTASVSKGNDPAARRRDVNTNATNALNRLYSNTPGARELVGKARGVLVFPSVIAAGLGVGGQYGDGVLQVGGAPVDYYNLASVSVGLQIGAQSKAIIFLFMTPDALDKFRASEGWSVGADASVALLKVGANGEIDANVARSPTVAFVMTNAGLMADASLEATRISRID